MRVAMGFGPSGQMFFAPLTVMSEREKRRLRKDLQARLNAIALQQKIDSLNRRTTEAINESDGGAGEPVKPWD